MDFGSDYVVFDENSEHERNFSITSSCINNETIKDKELNAIKYLCLLKEPSKILNSINAFNALQCLLVCSNCSFELDTLIDQDLQTNLVTTIIDFLKRQLENLSDLISKFDNIENRYKSIYYLEIRFDYLMHFLNILFNYSKNSASLCIKFHENKGVKVLFSYLKNQFLYRKLNEFSKNKKSDAFKSLNSLVTLLLGCIKNLSCHSDKFKNDWDHLNSIDFLLEISKSISKFPDIQILSYISLANVFNDKYTDKLNDIKIVIENLVYLVKFLSNKISLDENLDKLMPKQEQAILNKNDKIIVDFIECNIIELLNCLYKLAVNDTIKYDMYEIYSMKEYLRLIIYNGNNVEKEHAIKLLWQFCFDQRIAKDVKEDNKLFEFINTLSKDENNSIKSLKENSCGIIWLLGKKTNETQKDKILKWIKPNDLKETVLDEKKNIMISYNRENRDLCLTIKNELESAGFSIWIDVENIYGSSLESMAKAIENSECVFVCMTEKYKQSPNCRAEAEYAFQIKKPIVPLIMQKSYKPDGWLGIILGSKIFVDFTKYEFDECMKRLKKEILGIFNTKYSVIDSSQTETSLVNPKSASVISSLINSLSNELNPEIDWSEKDVDKWLETKKFHKFIVDSVRPCDGRLLHSMYKMLETAPESFYSSLNTKGQLCIRELVYFSSELKNLFSI